MPLPGPTDKKKHWQSIVLTPLVTPGTYNNACVTVNEYGLVTGISSCPTASFIVVDVPANLPTPGTGPLNGDLAVVRDNSSGGDPAHPEAMYVYDDDGSVGSPQWRLLADTAAAQQRIDYREALATIAAFTPLGSPVSLASKVKSATVQIISAYPPGTTMRIEDTGPTIYMDSTAGDIDPTTPGQYTVDVSGNSTVVGGLQLNLVIGGFPGFGNSYAYVEFTN